MLPEYSIWMPIRHVNSVCPKPESNVEQKPNTKGSTWDGFMYISFKSGKTHPW
jgi:hypothetical protein